MNKKVISLLLGAFLTGIGMQIKAMDSELNTMIQKYHNKAGVEVYSMFSEALAPESNIAYLKELYSILDANKNPNENNQVSWVGLESLYMQLFKLFNSSKEKDSSKVQNKPEEQKKTVEQNKTQIKQYRIAPSNLEMGIGIFSLLTVGYFCGWLMHSSFNAQ